MKNKNTIGDILRLFEYTGEYFKCNELQHALMRKPFTVRFNTLINTAYKSTLSAKEKQNFIENQDMDTLVTKLRQIDKKHIDTPLDMETQLCYMHTVFALTIIGGDNPAMQKYQRKVVIPYLIREELMPLY